MPNYKEITGAELVDFIPVGDHRVIIDSFEKRDYDDYTYLDFQLVGLEGEALDKEIKHGVPYSEWESHEPFQAREADQSGIS